MNSQNSTEPQIDQESRKMLHKTQNQGISDQKVILDSEKQDSRPDQEVKEVDKKVGIAQGGPDQP